MTTWHNDSGKPLSSPSWLLDHHKAKYQERITFARSIMPDSPSCITDLGCGTGLWLEIFNEIAPEGCELIGLDSDKGSIELAKDRAKNWKRKTRFEVVNLSKKSNIPFSDLFLAFNIFPYLKSTDDLLSNVRNKLNPNAKLIVRQYDGAAMRFGPMDSNKRLMIDNSLHTAISNSSQFHHYDLDRVFEILSNSEFSNIDLKFEVLSKTSPYTKEFLTYYKNTIDWTKLYVNDASRKFLGLWQQDYLSESSTKSSYFEEIYLVGIIS